MKRVMVFLLLLGSSCGGGGKDLTASLETSQNLQDKIEEQKLRAAQAPGAIIPLRMDDFYTPRDPKPDTGCAGDTKTYYPTDSQAGQAFESSLIDPTISLKPDFLANVSLDLTDVHSSSGGHSTCWIQDVESNYCAALDSSKSSFEPVFASGFYSFFDLDLNPNPCHGAGVVNTTDPEIGKTYTGSVYIDLDRSALRPIENLLLHVSYLPLGLAQNLPGRKVKGPETPIIRIHLVHSGLSPGAIRQAFQPRHLSFGPASGSTRVIQSLAILAPPLLGWTEEQVILPLGLDPSIDRVIIERETGSAILGQVALHRTQRTYQ